MNISTAAAASSPVTVTRTDGKSFTGTPVELEPGLYKIETGKRGRPAVIAAASVQSVEPASAA